MDVVFGFGVMHELLFTVAFFFFFFNVVTKASEHTINAVFNHTGFKKKHHAFTTLIDK